MKRYRECSKCGGRKDEEEFSISNRSTGKKCSWCKECMSHYDKLRYKKIKSKRDKQIKKKAEEYLTENMTKIREYLKSHPCTDCGESDPIVLQFDHLSGKRANISMIVRSWKWETVKEEIGKCEVRCANCHMRRTAKQLGWYKYLK